MKRVLVINKLGIILTINNLASGQETQARKTDHCVINSTNYKDSDCSEISIMHKLVIESITTGMSAILLVNNLCSMIR